MNFFPCIVSMIFLWSPGIQKFKKNDFKFTFEFGLSNIRKETIGINLLMMFINL